MKSTPLISIIVPIYKVELYLPKCIDSIVNQTYKDLEIILVDDGSPDGCGNICDQYATHDERIKVIHKKNGGLSDARNVGIEIACGDYLMFVDSDDWIDLNTCESVIETAVKHNADIVVFGVKFVYNDGKTVLSRFGLKGKIEPVSCIKGMIYHLHETGVYNFAVNKLYKRELFDTIRYPTNKLAEDQDTTYRVFHKAKSIWVCEENLYNYFQRKGSISSTQFSSKLLQDRIELWLERFNFLETNYPEIAIYQLAQVLGDIYVGLIVLKNKPSYSSFFQEIKDFAYKHKSSTKKAARYNRKVALHYYCYPLFWLYVKLFIKS